MKLKKVDKNQFCRTLSSSLLTPERCSQMYASYSGIPGDSDAIIDDNKLLDCYADIFKNDASIMHVINLLRNDESYAPLTKGFVNVDATYQNLEHFLIRDSSSVDRRYNINVRVATSLLREMMNIQVLKPNILTQKSNVMDFVANGDAVCGTICSGKKKDHERVLRAYAMSIKKSIAANIPFERIWIPAKGGHRAQLSNIVGEDGKVNPFKDIKKKDRYVWAIDGGTGVVEAQYSMPITSHLKHADFFSPGKEPYRQRELIKDARRASPYWTSIDYSKFDQTIPRWLIAHCFDIVKDFYPKQFHKEIGWIAHNFIHTKVVVPGGMVYQKDHGIPSGSGFTQIIGTMANMIIMLTFISSTHNGGFEDKLVYLKHQLQVGLQSERKYSIFAQGDDNLVFTKDKLDMHALSEYAHAMFGVVINPDKCDAGDKNAHPSYLKREWRQFGEWQNPIYLVVNTSHPEHYRSYDGYSPWHIIYCLWLTYRYAFPANLSEDYLILQMHKHGGVGLLLRIPRESMPGVAKAFPETYRKLIFERAERKLSALAA